MTLSEAGRRRATVLSGGTFLACNLGLAAKNGLEPNLEGAAGVSWMAASLSMWLVRNNPDLGFRVVGACGLGGAMLLSANGIDFHTGHIQDLATVAGPLVGFAPSAAMLLFREQVMRLAASSKEGAGRFERGLVALARRPVRTSAGLNLIGVASMAWGAWLTGDPWMAKVVAGNLAANAALVLSEPPPPGADPAR